MPSYTEQLTFKELLLELPHNLGDEIQYEVVMGPL